MSTEQDGPGPEKIRSVVEAYMTGLTSGTADDIAALYAPDAVIEDPVGGGIVQDTPEKILTFYRNIEPLEKTATLLEVRICGCEALFRFSLEMRMGEGGSVIEPIDVMTFDGDGRITSMKAYWTVENMTPLG